MPEENNIYTFPVEYVYEILDESEKQVAVAEDLLQELYFYPPKNSKLISMIIEILWANFTILKLLDEEIETAVLHENETTGESELMVLETTMWYMQQLMLTRSYANRALNNLSYSVSLH